MTSDNRKVLTSYLCGFVFCFVVWLALSLFENNIKNAEMLPAYGRPKQWLWRTSNDGFGFQIWAEGLLYDLGCVLVASVVVGAGIGMVRFRFPRD